jgi:MFS transporter, ACS family, hexuronate transporter
MRPKLNSQPKQGLSDGLPKTGSVGWWRWAILALLFLAGVLNYVDRQVLSILAPRVQSDLGIDDLGYAHIVQCFLFAYSASYLVAGWVTDKLGTRLALALCLGWWSAANIATGLMRGAISLGIGRILLGLGESGLYTAAPKAIGEHFEPELRGLAFGLFTSGAMIGATVAPPLIGGLAITYGWRAAFVVTGAVGFVVVAAWLIAYRRPSVTVLEAGTADTIDWGPILRDPTVWTLATARLIADPVWYFYLFWLPKYLADARGMSLLAIAQLAWLVYLASDIGSVGGGWFSGWLIRRGGTPVRSRMIAMTIAAALAPFGMLIAAGVGIGPTLALAALVAFAHLVFQVNMGTLIVDLYPQRTVSTVFGIIAAGSGLGGIFSTQLVGNLASGGSYDRVFLMMGLLHPLACAAVWATPALRKRTVVRSAL